MSDRELVKKIEAICRRVVRQEALEFSRVFGHHAPATAAPQAKASKSRTEIVRHDEAHVTGPVSSRHLPPHTGTAA